MSWSETTWSQDDTLNDGYPFVTDPGIAEKYTHSSVKSIWTLQENENDGYPVITDPGTAPKYDYTSVKSIWKFKNDVNFGFPYIVTIDEEKPLPPVFRAFSMSGLSAGFKKTSTSTTLTGNRTINFCFPERKNIVFHLKFSKEKIDLTE